MSLLKKYGLENLSHEQMLSALEQLDAICAGKITVQGALAYAEGYEPKKGGAA